MKKIKKVLGLVIAGTAVGLSLTSCMEDGTDGLNGTDGLKGDKGDAGKGIESITKTDSKDTLDIYTISYTDGTKTTFTISNGVDGTDGKSAMFQIYNGYLQAKYDTDLEWKNILAISDITEAAKTYTQMQVKDGYIQYKNSSDDNNSWTNLISLETLTGEAGASTELRVYNGFIQWKSSGDWANIIELSSLAGNDGREVVISTSADAIVWQYEGDSNWNEIVELSTLKGDTGKSAYEIAVDVGFEGTASEWLSSLKGATGDKMEIQVADNYLQWKYTTDTEWQNLLSIDDIHGENGKSAFEIYKDKYTYKGTEYEWIVDLVDGNLFSGTTHKVTYMSNDAEYLTQNTHEGKNAEKPTDPTREGYKFLGWYDENDDKWVFNGYEIHQDTTLYAKWEYIISAIHLNTNGAYIENKILYANEGDLVNLPTPVKEGYTFNGWYLGEEKIESGAWAYDHDVTLEAKWTANTYTITLDPTTGTLEDTTKEVTIGESFTLPAAYTPDVDKPFVGWFTEDGTRVTEMDGVSVNKYSVAGNITLYARYGVKISTVEDLKKISNNLAGSYILMNDIDMTGVIDWTPIGTDDAPFTGILNGNGHAISNMEFHNIAGLFLNVSNATFLNLTIKNAYMTSNQEITNMAILTAKSDNTTYTDINFDHITINNSNSVTYTGVLAGYASNCEINNCNVSNLVLTTALSKGNIGGICGYFSTGTINTVKVSGTIKGGNLVGGVVGYNSASEYNNCYNYSEVSGGYSAGIVGYTQTTLTMNQSGNYGKCDAALIGKTYSGNWGSASALKCYIKQCFNFYENAKVINVVNANTSSGYYYYIYIEDGFFSNSKIYSNAFCLDDDRCIYVTNSYYETSQKESQTNCVVLSSIEDKTILTKDYYVNTLGWSELVWDFSNDSLGYVVPKLKFIA